MTPPAWDSAAPRERLRVDAALAVLLFATVAIYLAALPLNLSIPDEAHALLAAKRVRTGEVLYRDIFDLSTPGWVYFTAGLFSLFGATLATARVAVAVIHAITAVLVFVACRGLGVRGALAWAAGLGYLVICQPMFPVASYHWLATCLCTALLVLCLRPNDTPRWAFGLGVIVGLLIAVHQQRGIVTGLGVAALLVGLSILRWPYGGRWDVGPLLRQLGALAAGALLIVTPMLLAIVARAGSQPVWEALVVFPLVNYRTAHQAAHYGFVFGAGRAPPSPIALFLRYLPVAAALSAISLLTLAWQRRGYGRARSLAVLALLGGFSVASIMYYPDVIHIAFIAPFFFIALAELVEWALCRTPAQVDRALGLAIAAAIVLGGGVRLVGNAVALKTRYPIAYQSAFGRVDLASTRERQFWEELRERIDTAPVRTLYAYPSAGYVHLLVDAENATRFGLVVPSSPYTPPEQIREIVDGLASKRVPYVVAGASLMRADDPIARYVREHYRPIDAPQPLASALWERKHDAASGHDGG